MQFFTLITRYPFSAHARTFHASIPNHLHLPLPLPLPLRLRLQLHRCLLPPIASRPNRGIFLIKNYYGVYKPNKDDNTEDKNEDENKDEDEDGDDGYLFIWLCLVFGIVALRQEEDKNTRRRLEDTRRLEEYKKKTRRRLEEYKKKISEIE